MDNESLFLNLSCPSFDETDIHIHAAVNFWLGGVIQSALGIVGIMTNMLSCYILTRKSMKNSFNLLLVTLASFDGCYLIGAIFESFWKAFGLVSEVYLRLFPHLVYPLHQASMTGSIFMTVAIAFERYKAVYSPINFNQDTSSAILQYTLPVLLLSIAFNIPKFFEAEVVEPPPGSDKLPHVDITDLRRHPIYSSYNNWSRLLVLGLIPFFLLVFFNAALYRRIRSRRRRRQLHREKQQQQQQRRTTGSSPAEVREESQIQPKQQQQQQQQQQQEQRQNQRDLDPNNIARAVSDDAESLTPSERSSNGGFSSSASERRRQNGSNLFRTTKCSLKRARQRQDEGQHSQGQQQEDDGTERIPMIVLKVPNINNRKSRLPFCRSGQKASRSSGSTSRRSSNEDSLAMVFMGIVVIFLVCNTPRILLNLFELANFKRVAACDQAGRNPFALWTVVTVIVSHALLVFNSATNMIVYCLLSSKFRQECIATQNRIRSAFARKQ